MWEKLNIFGFGWGKKKPAPQPIQKEISVNIVHGDRKETIQRSPGGTKIASSSTTKNRLDDDESSEGSTSVNFGFKVGPAAKRAASFSFTREPLDMETWSNVTSPGFTSRLIQQASGHSPLKEFNDSMSHSPFRKSPYKDLGLGELPYVDLSRKPRVSAPGSLTLPTRSMRPGVTSSIYNRDRRKNARQGQVFVRIAPIDPNSKGSLAINKKSSSPSMNMTNGHYPGGPRGVNESFRADGLGGIPQHQHELAMRFNRMWPTPGSPVPGPGRPLSPTSPSNIMEALASGRKRGREQDSYYPHNATPPSVSPPSKISIGIGDTPVRSHQMQKRVKFIGGPDNHDRPMMTPYAGIGGGDHEPLSSESILEQMNQTEKRFLPDSTSTPYSLHKKGIRMSEDSTSNAVAGPSGLRKRRSQTNIMNAGDEETKGEKFGRYCCPCNECYAEATGNLNRSSDLSKTLSPSKIDSNDTSFSIGTPKSKKLCDIGVGPDNSKAEYFKELFRKADKKKKPENDFLDDDDEITRVPNTVVTKEMYDRDKRKRVERYYKMLKLKPPNESLFDTTEPDFAKEKSASTATTTSATMGFSFSGPPIATTTSPSESLAPGGFNFGSPSAPVTSSGFAFGKQSSPIAQTITTSACPTITSASVTGTMFGSPGQQSSTSTLATIPSFGLTSTTTTPAPVSSNLATATSPDSGFKFENTTGTSEPTTTAGSGLFSFGSNPITTSPKPWNPNESVKLTSPTTNTDATQEAPKPSGGFSFSGGSSSTVPSFGVPAATTSASAPTLTANPSFSFGSIQTTPKTSADQVDNAASTATTTVEPATSSALTLTAPVSFKGFGEKSDKPSQEGGGGFSFGQSIPTTTSASSTTTGAGGLFQFGQQSNSNPPPPYSFGQLTTTAAVAGLTQSPAQDTFKGFGATSEKPSTQLPTFNPKPTLGGFSFSSGDASASSGALFGQKTTSAVTTTTPALNTTTTTAPLSIFGGAGNSSLIKSPETTKSDSIFGATTTTASTTLFGATSPSGNIFGGGQPTSTPSNPVFGLQSTTSNPAVTSAPSVSFGTGPAFGGGNLSFGAVAAKPNNAQQPSAVTAGGGFNFSGGATSLPAFGGFSSPATTTSASAPSLTFGSGSGTFGQSSFPVVPNPLANKNTSSTFSSLSSNTTSPPPATTAPPAFGGFGNATSPPVFGGTTASNSGTFSFGQAQNNNSSTLPQAQSPTPAFAFGNTAATAAPAPQPNTGFSFGQSNPAIASPPQASPGVFQFGQPQANTGGATPFQFGQAAQQPAGFNFGGGDPTGGAPMFSVGTSNTAARRRDVRRRHR